MTLLNFIHPCNFPVLTSLLADDWVILKTKAIREISFIFSFVYLRNMSLDSYRLSLMFTRKLKSKLHFCFSLCPSPSLVPFIYHLTFLFFFSLKKLHLFFLAFKQPNIPCLENSCLHNPCYH